MIPIFVVAFVYRENLRRNVIKFGGWCHITWASMPLSNRNNAVTWCIENRKCFRCSLPYSRINPSILNLICKMNLYVVYSFSFLFDKYIFVLTLFCSIFLVQLFRANKTYFTFTFRKKISSAAASVSSLNVLTLQNSRLFTQSIHIRCILFRS